MLRLATALARLRFSTEVVIDDFDEAVRLMEVTLAPAREAAQGKNNRQENTYIAIYKLIRSIMLRDEKKLEWR